jgi:hypothetical protein
VGLREPPAGLAVRGRHGVADVAVALGGDMGSEQRVAQLQQALEETTLDRIETQRFVGGGADKGGQVGELHLRLEKGLLLGHDHGGLRGGRGHHSVSTDVLPPGGRLCHAELP